MTPEQFAYWLQGYAELHGDTPPTPEQWQAIREHLQTVFHKATPPNGIRPALNQAPYYRPTTIGDAPNDWPPGAIIG